MPKLIVDPTNPVFEDPLLVKLIFECAKRVRVHSDGTDGLNVGEFYLAETETETFGLKKTQGGILRRAVERLRREQIIELIENRRGNKNAKIYLFVGTESIYLDLEIENRIENKQRTEQRETKRDKHVQQVPDVQHVDNAKHEERVNMFINYLEDLPDSDVDKFYLKYNGEKSDFRRKGKEMALWYANLPPARQKKYSSPSLTLQKALAKDFGVITAEEKADKEDEIRFLKKMEEIGPFDPAEVWKAKEWYENENKKHTARA